MANIMADYLDRKKKKEENITETSSKKQTGNIMADYFDRKNGTNYNSLYAGNDYKRYSAAWDAAERAYQKEKRRQEAIERGGMTVMYGATPVYLPTEAERAQAKRKEDAGVVLSSPFGVNNPSWLAASRAQQKKQSEQRERQRQKDSWARRIEQNTPEYKAAVDNAVKGGMDRTRAMDVLSGFVSNEEFNNDDIDLNLDYLKRKREAFVDNIDMSKWTDTNYRQRIESKADAIDNQIAGFEAFKQQREYEREIDAVIDRGGEKVWTLSDEANEIQSKLGALDYYLESGGMGVNARVWTPEMARETGFNSYEEALEGKDKYEDRLEEIENEISTYYPNSTRNSLNSDRPSVRDPRTDYRDDPTKMLMDYSERQRTKAFNDLSQSNIKTLVDKAPVLANIGSVLLEVGQFMDIPAIADSAIKDIPLDTNALTVTNAREGVRDYTSQKISSGILNLLYQTGMSMADFALLMPLNSIGAGEAITLSLMGTNAAISATKEAAERGQDSRSALLTGIAAGVFESLFEKISIETLLKPGMSTSKVAFVIKNFLAEGSEEVATDLANHLFDKIANGGLSDFDTKIRNYMQTEGLSYEDAKKKASDEFAAQLALSFGGGAISGGLLGGFSALFNSDVKAGIETNNILRNEYKYSDLDNLSESGENVRSSLYEIKRNQAAGFKYTSALISGYKTVDELYEAAAPVQKELNNTMRDIANELGFSYEDSTQKSKKSIAGKLQRKHDSGLTDYSLMDMKDHTRTKLEMNSFEDIPAVLDALDERGIPYNTEYIVNEWGYHGFHVTWANENGITSELQLTTPEAWKLKIWSDGIYDKWRNRSENEMTDAEYKQYLSDVEESQKRWGKLWNQMDDPDLSLYERSSFSESTRPSQMSSTVTGDVGTVQVPFTNSLRQGLEGNLSTTRPSLSNVAISNTSQENNINVNNDINIINQRGGKSNLKTAMSSMPGADKIDKASVKAFEDAYDGSIDADTYAQGMTWGYIAGYYGMPEETALSRNEAFASLPASLQAQAHYAGLNYANNIPEGIERRLDELKDAQARARDAKTIDEYEEQIEALENRLEELSGSVRETSRYEAKQRYAEKRNAENAQIETLTEEQHEALADLAKIRHEIHSNWESIWSGNDDNLLDNVDEINNALEMAGLPQIETPDVTMLPLADDYYEVLSNSEREEWEARAEEEGYSSGIEAWRELSGEYDEFAQTLSEINDKIETYLSNIDKEHGTKYAPTGWARLKEDGSYIARTGKSFAREFSGEVDTDGWPVPVKRISSAIMQGYSHIDEDGLSGYVYTNNNRLFFKIDNNNGIIITDIQDIDDFNIHDTDITGENNNGIQRKNKRVGAQVSKDGNKQRDRGNGFLSGAPSRTSGSDDSVAGRESSGDVNRNTSGSKKAQRNSGQIRTEEDNQNRLNQKYSTDDLSNTVRDHQLTLDEYRQSIDSPKAKAERKQIAQALSELGTAASKIGKSDNVRTIALGIVDNFVEKGAVDYESVRLDTKNPEIAASQVAAYGMLLRDPRFETFRILFTKGDRIISVQSFTSRLVDRAYITKKMLDEIITKRNGLKADGYYIMHNHPSGDPSASNGDINTTRRFSKMIPGFKGHIIIDHNKYSYLNASGYTQGGIQTLANGKAETFEKRIVDHPLLFDKLNDPSKLAQAAIDLVHSKDVGVLAYCDAQGRLRAIEEVKNAFMKSTDAFEKYLADRKVQLGSPMAFLLVSDGVTFDDAAYDLQHLFLRNLVFDIVDQSGRSMYMGDSGLTVNIGGKIEDINGTVRGRMGYNPDGTIGEKAFEVKEVDAKGNVVVDEFSVEERDKLLQDIYDGKYKGKNITFPVLQHTPQVFLDYVDSSDRTFVTTSDKAYKSMIDHNLGKDGFIEALKRIYIPNYIIEQLSGKNAGHYIAIIELQDKETVVALDLGNYRYNKSAINEERGLYNVIITTFTPDSENYIDDIFGNEIEVKYDSSKDKKYEIPNQVALSETLSGHDNGISKQKLSQLPDSVNTENDNSSVREDVNYFIDTNDAAPDQELIDTKRQLNDALRELKKQTERAEYFKGQTRLTKQRRVTDRAVRDITKKYVDQVDTARLSKEEIAADITELANKTLNVPEEYTISSFREDARKIAVKIADNEKPFESEVSVYYRELLQESLPRGVIEVNKMHKPADFFKGKGAPGNILKRARIQIRFVDTSAAGGSSGIDSTWKELSSEYPSIYPPDVISEGDMLDRLVETVIEATEPKLTYNPYIRTQEDWDEYIDWFTEEILSDVLTMEETAPTFADKKKAEKAEAVRNAKEQVRQKERAKRDEAMRRLSEKAKISKETALEKLRERKDSQIKAIIEHQKQVQEAKRTRKIESADRTRLLNVARRLEKIKTNDANRQIIDSLIGELDLVSKSMTTKTLEDLSDLKAWNDALMETDPDYLPSKHLLEKIERLSKKHIADMDINDVRNLTDVLLGIEHTIRTEKKFLNDKIKIDTYQAGLNAIDSVRSSKGVAHKSSKRYKAAVSLLRPRTLMLKITGYNESSPLYQIGYKALADGEAEMIAYKNAAENKFKRFLDDKKFIKYMTETPITIGGLGADGMQEVTITPDLRAALYMHYKNSDNMWHIINGGIVIPEYKAFVKGNIQEAYDNGIRIKLTMSQVRSIIAKCDLKEVEFINAATDYYENVSKPALNKTSNAHVGYSIAMVENYFPISTNKNFLREDFGVMNDDGSIDGMGFLQERQQGAANPVDLISLTAQLKKDFDNHAKYVGLAIPVADFNRLYNMQQVGYETSVKEAISQKWGSPVDDYIKKMNASLYGARKQTSGADIIRSKYASAVLTGNIGVMFKQAASYPTAAAVLGWGSLSRALANVGPLSDYEVKMMYKYSPLQEYRERGYGTVELGDVVSRKGKTPKALLGIQKVDILTTRKLFKACIYAVKAQGVRYDTKEFWEKVGALHAEVIRQTQPNYTSLERPQVLRSDNALVSALVMFKTQPMQNYNLLYESLGNLKAKANAYRNGGSKEEYDNARKDFAKKYSGVGIGTLVLAAINMAWMMFVGKDDEYKNEDGEYSVGSITKGLGIDMLSNFAGMIPGGGEALAALENRIDNAIKEFGGEAFFNQVEYDISVPTIDAVQSLIDGVEAIMDISVKTFNLSDSSAADIEKNAFALEKAIENVAQFGGIPLANMRKLAAAITLNSAKPALGEYKGRYLSMRISQSVSKNKSDYASLLLEAYRNDKKAFKELYASMSTDEVFATDSKDAKEVIDSMLQTAIKKAYLAGTVTEKEAEKFLVDILDYDSDKVSWKIDGWEYSEENGDLEGHTYANKIFSAYLSGKTSEIREAKALFSTEKDAISTLKSEIGKRYKNGDLNRSAAEKYLNNWVRETGNDAFWTFDKWDYVKTHGDDEGYSKYSRWVTAIKSGKERTSAVQFYKDHGVSASTLAAQITSNFKDEYIKSGRTEAMKELLLDAYQAIAYVYDQEFNRYKKAYAIDKWTDD